MGNQALIDRFSTWQEGRAYSARTIRRRRNTLALFSTWVDMPFGEVRPDEVEEWVMTKPSPATRHAYRSDIVQFYRWAVRRGHVALNPAEMTDSIKVPKRLPRPLSAEQTMLAFASARSGDLQLMVALGAFAGLRVAEISALDASDVSTHTKVPLLTVRNGKGGKDRIVPIHPMLLQAFGRLPSSGRLFPRVSPDRVGKRLAAHLQRLGIDGTAHQLRHTFGTQAAAAANGNMVIVQYLMGHESLQTTMGYVGWSGGPAAEVVALMFQEWGTASSSAAA